MGCKNILWESSCWSGISGISSIVGLPIKPQINLIWQWERLPLNAAFESVMHDEVSRSDSRTFISLVCLEPELSQAIAARHADSTRRYVTSPALR